MEVTNAAVPESRHSLPLRPATGNKVWMCHAVLLGACCQAGVVIKPVSLPFGHTGAWNDSK